MSDDVLPLGFNNGSNGQTRSTFQLDSIKEDVLAGIHRSESCVVADTKGDSDTMSFFKAKDKLQMKSENLKGGNEVPRKECDCEEKYSQKQKDIVRDYENQVNLLKSTYQKQISHLQECLEKQIEENRNLRGKYLEETNRIIEEERTRNVRLHQE